MNYEAERERFARHLEGSKWTIDYAIRATVMEAICDELYGRSRILEFGAGYSSYCLRQLGGRVSSYDHDIDYAECVETYLWHHHQPYPTVGIIADWKAALRWHFPTEAYAYDGILVDHGPDMSDRIYDLPTIAKCLSPDGVIILDDWKGAYKKQATPKLKGFTIQTRRDGSRHWGVARRC